MKLKTIQWMSQVLPGIFVCLIMVATGLISFSLVTHAEQIESESEDGPQADAFDICYPSTYRPPLSVKSQGVDQVTYWEVEAESYDPNDQGIHLVHFRTEPTQSHTKCKWLNRNQPSFRTAYLPKPVAVSFAKGIYQPLIASCLENNAQKAEPLVYCRSELTKGLSGLTPKTPNTLFPEDIDALMELGIDVNQIESVTIAESAI